MSRIVDIFLQPSSVLAAEQQRPTFLVPFCVLAALTTAMAVAYFWRVDPQWYSELMLTSSGQSLSASERAQLRNAMPGPHVVGWLTIVTGLVTLTLLTLLTAAYITVVGKFAPKPLSFRHGLSLATWSAMPTALGMLVAIGGALTMTGRTTFESLMLTNIDPLFIDLPADHRWNRLAESANLLLIWNLFLFALGWKMWSRTSWARAIVVAVVPMAVLYGMMALIG